MIYKKYLFNVTLPDDGLESSEEDDVDDFFSMLLSRFGIFVAGVFLAAFLLVIVNSFCVSVKNFFTTELSSNTGLVDSLLTFGTSSTVVMTAFVVSFDVTKSTFNLTSVFETSSPPTGGTLGNCKKTIQG